MADCALDHEHGAKCYAEGMAVAPMIAATSWDEVDAQQAVMEQTEHVQEVTAQYNAMVNTIAYSDMDPSEKVRMLTDAAAGYGDRLQGAMSHEEMMAEKAYRPGPLARFLGYKAKSSEGLGPDAYAIVPDPDVPTGWKLRIDDASHISGAIQALSPAGFRGQRVQLEAGERTKALSRIRAAINKLPEGDRGNLPDRLAALKALDTVSEQRSVVLLRAKDGTPERFALWAGNIFEDRSGEIFPAEAVEAAVERFNARAGAKGHVNVWHVGHPKFGWAEGQRGISDWGEIEHAAYIDGFVFVEGRVTDAKAAARIPPGWGTSFEYEYLSGALDGGVYSSFDFDRVSVLPRERACNPWNPMQTITLGVRGEATMPFVDEEQRKAVETLWGPEFVATIEAQAKHQADVNKAQGLAYKSVDVVVTAPNLKFAIKDDEAAAVAEATAEESPPAATDEVPAWAKQILDQQAVMLARMDQGDAQVKALEATVTALPPAAGIFGRSVTTASAATEQAAKDAAAQDAALAQYQQTGQVIMPEEIGELAEWGAAGKAMMMMGGRMGGLQNGGKPAGA